ncbi:hypothetical protein [Haladaptatus sp. AB618]|nr:hypothetical protein [Haladaptatus sp. AB618]
MDKTADDILGIGSFVVLLRAEFENDADGSRVRLLTSCVDGSV